MAGVTINREKLGGSFRPLRDELKADPDYGLAVKLHRLSADIGRRIAAIRKEVGFTQVKVAEKLGVDQSLIARLESKNPARVPTLLTIARVADACGYDVDVVLKPRTPHPHVIADEETAQDRFTFRYAP